MERALPVPWAGSPEVTQHEVGREEASAWMSQAGGATGMSMYVNMPVSGGSLCAP